MKNSKNQSGIAATTNGTVVTNNQAYGSGNFLPEDDSTAFPAEEVMGKYFKPASGANKMRIIMQPIIALQRFVAGENGKLKVERFRLADRPADAATKPVKKFYGYGIYNYSLKRIQIWTCDKATINNAIRELASDKNWGDFRHYDLVITKTGKELETKYCVHPIPPSQISDEVLTAFTQTPLNLNALFSNEDPFAVAPPVAQERHGIRGLAL